MGGLRRGEFAKGVKKQQDGAGYGGGDDSRRKAAGMGVEQARRRISGMKKQQ